MARVKKIKCPKCKRSMMEMFGVTETGARKYACPRCFHHIEKRTVAKMERR